MVRALRLATLAVLAGVLALSVVPSLTSQVDDMDVLIYAAAAARANAEHALPYVAAWVEKGPLAMAWYQALDAVFGRYPMGAIALSVLLFHALATAGVYGCGRLLGGPRAALWAAALYAVAVGSVGGTLNTEVPAAAMAALAWWAWLRPGGLRRAALAGLLASAAALSRQNAGALWPLMLLGELLRWRDGSLTLRRAGYRALAVTAGFLSPVLAVVLVYAAAGALDLLAFCVYGYNAHIYVAATRVTAARLAAIPVDLWRNFFALSPTMSSLGLAALAAGLARPRSLSPEKVATALAAVGLTASLVLGLRWFGHYFLLAMPFWSLLGGLTAGALTARGKRPAVALAAAAVIVAGSSWEVASREPRRGLGRALRLLRGPAVVADPTTWPGANRTYAALGRFLRARAGPGDRAFVWGMRPHAYVLSGLVPSTRFVIGTFLTGLVPWERVGSAEDTRRWIVPGSRALLMADLEGDPPRFVVDASDDPLFAEGAYALSTFPELDAFVRARYRAVWQDGTVHRVVVWERTDRDVTSACRAASRTGKPGRG
ncbi:MAG TPA: hypothetical protein VFV75_13485 [Candidatus Polarisedimenticolaceae bacterium]|nr:hypothetical protein [Candidatus Polarisedimenticolaceae bacterium]